MKPILLKALKKAKSADGSAVRDMLSIFLKDGELPPKFVELVKVRTREKGGTDDGRARWLAALICCDARDGVALFEEWLRDDPERAKDRAGKVLIMLVGDRTHGLSSLTRTYENAADLLRLLKVAHEFMPPTPEGPPDEDDGDDADGDRGGLLRDRGQNARDQLLPVLAGIPGPGTHQALLEVATVDGLTYPKDQVISMAEKRSELDAEAELPEWRELAVAEFGHEAERTPSNEVELLELALSRLDDLKLELEEGDESEAPLWRKVDGEIQLRNSIANRLKQASKGKYTVASEEEKTDAKRTDIRLHNSHVEENLPIELKIPGQWQATALRDKLEKQLVGDYMRRAVCGVFLVVNCGRDNDRKDWTVEGKKVGFGELVAWLCVEATKIMSRNPTIRRLEVVDIDLAVRVRK